MTQPAASKLPLWRGRYGQNQYLLPVLTCADNDQRVTNISAGGRHPAPRQQGARE